MKILMFGWEFPPHISGGLGTACFGLSTNLATIKNADLTFVAPKANQTQKGFKLICANQVKIEGLQVQKTIPFKFFEINANLIPYTSAEEYALIENKSNKINDRLVEASNSGCFQFNANYGEDLFNEVLKYAVVAQQISSEDSFDIIHAHDWMSFPAGIEAQKQTGKPLIVHIHSTEFDRNINNINPSIYSIEKEGMLAAQRIIAVSEHSKQQIVEKYEIDAKKIVVLYNGIALEKRHKHRKIKKHFDEKLVTFLGRITDQKGPAYFIMAAYEILKSNKDYRFVMAGDGHLRPQMIELVAQLGISDRFHFTGFLDPEEVRQLFSISFAYVLPSVSEPFGLTVLEAIQAKVPVIASKNAGVSEVIENIIKIDYWNTSELAKTISDISHNEENIKGITEKAYQELNSLSWKKVAIQLYNLYLETIKNTETS